MENPKLKSKLEENKDADAAKDVREYFDTLVKEVARKAPRRKWFAFRPKA